MRANIDMIYDRFIEYFSFTQPHSHICKTNHSYFVFFSLREKEHHKGVKITECSFIWIQNRTKNKYINDNNI